jgi:hypothetical protein
MGVCMKSFFASVDLYLFRLHLSFSLTDIMPSHLISTHLHTNSGKEHDTKGHGVPETKGTSEGSASRNIQRKSDHVKGYVRPTTKKKKLKKCV